MTVGRFFLWPFINKFYRRFGNIYTVYTTFNKLAVHTPHPVVQVTSSQVVGIDCIDVQYLSIFGIYQDSSHQEGTSSLKVFDPFSSSWPQLAQRLLEQAGCHQTQWFFKRQELEHSMANQHLYYKCLWIYNCSGGWTSVYQLFWCEQKGHTVLTHGHKRAKCRIYVWLFLG